MLFCFFGLLGCGIFLCGGWLGLWRVGWLRRRRGLYQHGLIHDKRVLPLFFLLRKQLLKSYGTAVGVDKRDVDISDAADRRCALAKQLGSTVKAVGKDIMRRHTKQPAILP